MLEIDARLQPNSTDSMMIDGSSSLSTKEDTHTTWTKSSGRTRAGSATCCVRQVSRHGRRLTVLDRLTAGHDDVEVCRHTSPLTGPSQSSSSSSVSMTTRSVVSARHDFDGLTSSSTASRDGRFAARVLSVDDRRTSSEQVVTVDVGWLYGGTFSLPSDVQLTTSDDGDDTVSSTVRSRSVSSSSQLNVR